jgi:hypothetical protein
MLGALTVFFFSKSKFILSFGFLLLFLSGLTCLQGALLLLTFASNIIGRWSLWHLALTTDTLVIGNLFTHGVREEVAMGITAVIEVLYHVPLL